jgi:hypothetical protein
MDSDFEREIEIPSPANSETQESPFRLGNIDFEISSSFRGGSAPRSKTEVSLWSFAAVLIDLLCCLGASLLLAAALVYLSQDNKVGLFAKANAESFIALYAVLVLNYLLIFRAFLGFTISEWSCYLRLGFLQDYDSANYLLRVLFRTILIAVSLGSIPLLSLIFSRDLAGELTGLKIQSLK